MTTARLWEAKVGRISMITVIIASASMDEAIDLAVEWLKVEKSDWKGVDRSDVRAIKELDQIAVLKSS